MKRFLTSLLILLALGGASMSVFAEPSSPLPDALRQQYVAAYHKLRGHGLESHPIAALPTDAQYAQIDVSDQIRSASFGHKTTVFVPLTEGQANRSGTFYVGYGRSTNTRPAWFGPFHLDR